MKKHVVRTILCLLLIVAAFLLQSNFCRLFPYFRVAPNLLLIVTLSIGFLRGKTAGMFTGLLCGLLYDAFSGGILGYHTLIFLYIGYLNGFLSRHLVNDMILLPLILCFINEIVYSLYMYIFGLLLLGKSNFADYFGAVAVPELLLTLIGTIFVYGIVMSVNRALTAKEKEGVSRFV